MRHRLAQSFAILCVLIPAPTLAAKPKPVPTAPPAPSAPVASDWRTPDLKNLLVIDTNRGRIIVELYPDVAPASVERIKTLAHRNFYDGLTFFRVIDGFMDQTGDPQNNGTGGSDLPNVKGEFSFRRGADMPFAVAAQPAGATAGFLGALPVMGQSDDLMAMTADGKVTAWGMFCPGVAAMARAGDPDSANSQFFLLRDAYPSLERKYTPWGRVLIGEDVVRAIKIGEPVDPPQDKMLKVRLASDLPPADQPKIAVIDTRSEYFKGLIDKARADKGADFSLCDIDIPAQTR